jgi:hypothetical protein
VGGEEYIKELVLKECVAIFNKWRPGYHEVEPLEQALLAQSPLGDLANRGIDCSEVSHGSPLILPPLGFPCYRGYTTSKNQRMAVAP